MTQTPPALILAAGAAQSGTQRFGHVRNATPAVEAMEEFARLVAEKTGGEVGVQFFPDGQLGGARAMVEMLQRGALDMTQVSGGLLESFAPVCGVFSVPYPFDDQDQFHRAMDDAAIMGPLYRATVDLGFARLTDDNSGARSFHTVNRPVKSVADLAGLRIRVLQSPTAIRMTGLPGETPVATGQAKVYTSLQQGARDGAGNNEFALTVARHAEVARHCTLEGHSRISDILLVCGAFWTVRWRDLLRPAAGAGRGAGLAGAQSLRAERLVLGDRGGAALRRHLDVDAGCRLCGGAGQPSGDRHAARRRAGALEAASGRAGGAGLCPVRGRGVDLGRGAGRANPGPPDRRGAAHPHELRSICRCASAGRCRSLTRA